MPASATIVVEVNIVGNVARGFRHHACWDVGGQEAHHLDQAVRQLLTHTTPAHLLSAVGHALTRLPESPTR